MEKENTTMVTTKIGFLGAGQMASSLAVAFAKAGICAASTIILSDVYEPSLTRMSNDGFLTTNSNTEVVETADVVVLAVKPNIALGVLREISSVWSKDKTLVSICAGIKIDQLAKELPADSQVVRVMPNICCMIAEAASVYCCNENVPIERSNLVQSMLSSVGKCYMVKEYLIPAVVSVSGSGPAYVLEMIDALACAGVEGGLPRDVAVGLAAQTVKGAACLLLSSESKHPCQLRDQVCSPGGTTIAAVATLHEEGFHSAVLKAARVCRAKDIELGQQK